MITDKQIKNLKSGDKLIFVEFGQVLSTQKGNVFTFSNWLHRPLNEFHFWQAQEILDMGNKDHNFGIEYTELFDPKIHKQYRVMNKDRLLSEEKQFIEVYGDA